MNASLRTTSARTVVARLIRGARLLRTGLRALSKHPVLRRRPGREHPSGSGRKLTLAAVADELADRLTALFLPDAAGHRPVFGQQPLLRDDPAWRDLVPFHEYFHGEDGRGLGASHQTGWTALVADLLLHRRVT